jgi:hypothetical protein
MKSNLNTLSICLAMAASTTLIGQGFQISNNLNSKKPTIITLKLGVTNKNVNKIPTISSQTIPP